MKHLLTTALGLLFLPALTLAGPATISIRPGLLTQGASVGIRNDRWNPLAGLDLLWVGAHYETSDTREYSYSANGTSYLTREYTDREMRGHALVLVPHIGARYDLIQSGEPKPRPPRGRKPLDDGRPKPAADKAPRPQPLSLYLRGTWFFSLPSVEVDDSYSTTQVRYENGVQTSWQRIPHSDSYSEEKETAEDVLSFWGFDLAVGAEYPLSPHFGIGGEYGLRLLWDTVSPPSRVNGPDDPGYGDTSSAWQEQLSVTLRVSYAAVSLNYKF